MTAPVIQVIHVTRVIHVMDCDRIHHTDLEGDASPSSLDENPIPKLSPIR